MIRFRWLRMQSLFAIMAMSIFASPALAKKIDADTPLMVVGDGTPASSRTIKKNEAIGLSRVVYARLAVAEEDIFGSDGKVIGNGKDRLLLTKGDQLFGVVARNGQVTYCSVKHKPVGALDGIFVVNRDKHTCFVDQDKDGRFDFSYDLRTGFTTIPIYYYAEITGNPLTHPVQYKIIDPRSLELPIQLEFEIARYKVKKNTAQILLRLSSKDDVDYIASFEVDFKAEKPAFDVVGAKIRLSAPLLDQFSVELEGPSDNREFTTMRPTVVYNFITI